MHEALLARFHADINGIHLACRQLRTRQQEVSSVLQHVALTLQHVNPTASAAISNMILGIDNLCKDVMQRTANLRESVNAIPEPPPPPAKEPAVDDVVPQPEQPVEVANAS